MSTSLPSKVNVLLIGGGGREHAIAWKLQQSSHLGQLWIQPSANAALQSMGRVCPEEISVKRAFFLKRWCEREEVSLVIIGPEGPLAEGLTDALASPNLRVFGPTQAGARLEFDKAFAKQMMRQASIPTADARAFTTMEQAVRYLTTREDPVVIKATGLCQGKGVVVCDTRDDALDAIERIMVKREFGDAGTTVLIEERLKGQELSVLALVDGSNIWVLDPCQDHKQVGEGDVGPNTGGMGAYSPTPLADEATMTIIHRDVLVPIVDALRREGVIFRGVLFAGIMLTAGGPKVLEFNCRFGDPETQAIMVRLQGDLVEILWACAGGELENIDLSFDPRHACCVAVCSGGYPGEFAKGRVIGGLESAAAAALEHESVMVFHAGTARNAAGELVTSGGRVLTVTALAASLSRAQALANEAAARISFEGAFFRRDIGHRVLAAL
ncbi:MAG: phosphoribosylamine--glycine ligase [Phycisphaerales bacterium]|nr:phosphoribosylamine--glycine ligase [Phycisphaerales bacterium]